MGEIIYTDEFGTWYAVLSEIETRLVDRVVGLLEAQGFRLGHPYSSAVVKTELPLRELRVTNPEHPIRIFYAFDKMREAVLIIGGSKKGDDRFYERMVPLAERIWLQYLEEQKGTGP